MSTFKPALLWMGLGAALLWQMPAIPATEPAANPNHFLFVVNTSSAMKSRASYAGLVVADIIERGANARMRSGDTFTIWTYGDDARTNTFAEQPWFPESRRQISNQGFYHLNNLRWSGKANLGNAMAKVTAEMAVRKNLFVYLITTGEETMTGTTFDGILNETWQKSAPDMREQKGVCVTALVAENGTWVNWAVGMGRPPEPIREIAHNLQSPPPPAVVTNAVTVIVKPEVKAVEKTAEKPKNAGFVMHANTIVSSPIQPEPPKPPKIETTPPPPAANTLVLPLPQLEPKPIETVRRTPPPAPEPLVVTPPTKIEPLTPPPVAPPVQSPPVTLPLSLNPPELTAAEIKP
ncbi:MAG: hypothetical protein WCO56_03740, partial [Verrucomicrobiota bacterium]